VLGTAWAAEAARAVERAVVAAAQGAEGAWRRPVEEQIPAGVVQDEIPAGVVEEIRAGEARRGVLFAVAGVTATRRFKPGVLAPTPVAPLAAGAWCEEEEEEGTPMGGRRSVSTDQPSSPHACKENRVYICIHLSI